MSDFLVQSLKKLLEINHKKERPDDTLVFNCLTRLFGTSVGWFISGSYANRDVEDPRDIDVYFENPRLQRRIFDEVLHTHNRTLSVIKETHLSVTVDVDHIRIPIQLIKRTGNYLDIMEDFDLNVCKKALFTNGEYWEHPEANKPLHVCKFNYYTTERFFKYLERYHTRTEYKQMLTEVSKKFITTHITNDSIVNDYYGGTNHESTANQKVFDYFYEITDMRSFLISTAMEHAPELLI